MLAGISEVREARMANVTIPDVHFQDAVNSREERLDLEFKQTLDLFENAGKAKLAKEICALANHGGGWIVFGRKDNNGEVVSKLPDELTKITNDVVNEISATYLAPSPQCTLRWIKVEDKSIELPVVQVPSHGTVPICGAKNGPEKNSPGGKKGIIMGIRKGTYYNRVTGPKSEPMTSPADWKDLIHRCVLNDKAELFNNISVILSGPSPSSKSALDADLEFIVDEWRKLTEVFDEKPAPSQNFIVFGFELLGLSDQIQLNVDAIKQALGTLGPRVQGPHNFFEYVYTGDWAPYFRENANGDGLQANITSGEKNKFCEWPSLWRVSETGTGVNAVIYWEDSSGIKKAVPEWIRGSHVWIDTQMASIDDFLADTWDFANAVEFKGRVRIRIAYRGLKNRTLNSPRFNVSYGRTYVSKQETQDIDQTFELNALSPTVRKTSVALIAQELNKLFLGPSINAELVSKALTEYRRG